MELTVKKLKEILSQVNDDVLLADLEFGNDTFYPHNYIKRILLLEDYKGKQYLTINRMGSHFTGNGTQSGLKVIGNFDDYSNSFTNDKRNVARGEEKSFNCVRADKEGKIRCDKKCSFCKERFPE